MSTLHITVPMPPNIGNGGHYHWRTRDNQRKLYLATLDARQAAGLVPRPPKKPMTKARLRSVMHLGAAMDDDNAMRRHKWVLDWLRTRGYIADDKKKCLTWAGFPEQHVNRRDEYTIDLTLESA